MVLLVHQKTPTTKRRQTHAKFSPWQQVSIRRVIKFIT